MKSHKDLDAWKGSIQLVKEVYALTKSFPVDERYGLTDQIRRAVVSVPSNIAEGAGRGSSPDFIRFLYISLGSLSEVETQLIIALELGYLSTIEAELEKIQQIRNLINGLIRHLKAK